MDWLWLNAEKLGGLGGAASSVIALIAVLFAVWQIIASRSTAHEINAIQAYQAYLRLCIERPRLGSWEVFSKFNPVFKKPSDLFDWNKSNEDSESYLWFVSEMLQMCEMVLLNPHSKELEKSLKTQIGWHKETIIELWKRQGWAKSYSQKLRELVAQEIPSLKEYTKSQFNDRDHG